MLQKFGIETLELCEPSGRKKPVDEQTKILSAERDRLDEEIRRFRTEVLEPSRAERRYFNNVKDARKKLQMEVRRVRRFDRKQKDKLLHENLNIMTKTELKQWRVLSHKLKNLQLNLSQIQENLVELKETTKFSGLHQRLTFETETLVIALQHYHLTMEEIQMIVTKHYYKDKLKADEERERILEQSSTTARETPFEEMIQSELAGDGELQQ